MIVDIIAMRSETQLVSYNKPAITPSYHSRNVITRISHNANKRIQVQFLEYIHQMPLRLRRTLLPSAVGHGLKRVATTRGKGGAL